jgi:hypothetical protein
MSEIESEIVEPVAVALKRASKLARELREKSRDYEVEVRELN